MTAGIWSCLLGYIAIPEVTVQGIDAVLRMKDTARVPPLTMPQSAAPWDSAGRASGAARVLVQTGKGAMGRHKLVPG